MAALSKMSILATIMGLAIHMRTIGTGARTRLVSPVGHLIRVKVEI
jgi:hypothetical protein